MKCRTNDAVKTLSPVCTMDINSLLRDILPLCPSIGALLFLYRSGSSVGSSRTLLPTFSGDIIARLLLFPLLLLPKALTAPTQRLQRIIPHALHNTQPLRPALSEQQPITGNQILRPLHEPERYRRAVTGADMRSVNSDDSASLRDGPDMKHGLVFRLDSCGVGENEDCEG